MRLSPYSDSVSLRLQPSEALTLPHTITRRLIFQEARRHSITTAPTACRHAVSGLFHSPPGVLFTFPSRYCFSVGRQMYLALDRGRPGFIRNFTCSALLGCLLRDISVSLTGLSPSAARFPNTVQLQIYFVTLRIGCSLSLQIPLPLIHNACRLDMY